MAVELNINFNKFIEQLEHKLDEQGHIKHSEFKQFEAALDEQIDIYREVYSQTLQEQWQDLYPDIEFSPQLLESELNKYMASVKSQAQKEFHQNLKRNERLMVFKTLIFNRQKFWFWLGSIISLFSMPLCLVYALQPSDSALTTGLVGMMLNIIILVTLFQRSKA